MKAQDWIEKHYPRALDHHKDMFACAYQAGYSSGAAAATTEPKPDVFCNHHQSHTIEKLQELQTRTDCLQGHYIKQQNRLSKVEDQIADDYERMSKYAQKLNQAFEQLENLAGEIVNQHSELKEHKEFAKEQLGLNTGELIIHADRIRALKERAASKGLVANMVERITFLEGAVAGLVQKCEKFSEVVDSNFEKLGCKVK
jgi:chromosome segregation ATPase